MNNLGDIFGDLRALAAADGSFFDVTDMGGRVKDTVDVVAAVAPADVPPFAFSLIDGNFCSGTKLSSSRYEEPRRVWELFNSARYDVINACELSAP